MTDRQRHERAPWQNRATAFALTVLVGASLAGIAIGFVMTQPDDGELSVAYATWALALFTFFLAVGIPVTVWFSTKEREESSQQFLEQEQDRFYAQLDGTYLQIQKLVIEHPHLGDPDTLLKDANATSQQLVQYDAFAFIVWNFIESIHDFTRKNAESAKTLKRSEMLHQTWYCILEYEGARHAAWFERPENQRRFKQSFCDYIASKRDEWRAAQRTASAATA